MKEKSFHLPHSCAVCRNQPIWFSRVPDSNRTVKLPVTQWKPGVTDKDIWGAQVDDERAGTNEKTEALRMPSKSPFYTNEKECFESVEDLE